MKKNLVIIGKGNHSKVVLELIKEKKDLELILHFDGKDFKKLNERSVVCDKVVTE